MTDSAELEILTSLPSESLPVVEKLKEIFMYQVFEFHLFSDEKGEAKGYIPYMMNDALECFLILENCRVKGEFQPESEEKIQGRLAFSESGFLLAVRQGEENTFTLWFDSVREELKCYQYHEIGHFWVKGQEQWRQLVYMVGTIYDKYQYLGEAVCNEKELGLFRLMEFAPFRSWSPIGESLEGEYPDTLEGLWCMRSFAKSAKDWVFQAFLDLYERFPGPFLAWILAGRMQSRAREKLYEKIYNQVIEASKSYEKRVYGPEKTREIADKRKEAERLLKEFGFHGNYPVFSRKGLQVFAAEEHPFTILESEKFDFKIQFMVSEGKRLKGINSGFFRGGKGWIAKDLEFLKEAKREFSRR